MIEAIKEIGEYALEKEGKSVDDVVDILIQNPANKDTTHVLFIELNSGKNEFSYKGVNVEEYSKDKLGRYAYRKGSPNGTDLTPTSMKGKTIETTFKIKILNWFKEYKEFGTNENINFLVKTGKCLRDNNQQILIDLEEKYNKENNIISLKVDDKYIGEYEINGNKVFLDILVDRAKENFYFTKSFSRTNQFSKSENQICSVCNQRQPEVYGFVNTYNF